MDSDGKVGKNRTLEGELMDRCPKFTHRKFTGRLYNKNGGGDYEV